MFGTLRYILALMVVFGHLYPIRGGTWNWTGKYAVLSFYLLSGYLMTLVLHRRYGFSLDGTARYLGNRALRIYPPYLVAALLSLLTVFLFPEAAAKVGLRLRPPANAADWIENVVIFGLHTNRSSLLVPPAWSLSVELIYYVLMGILLSRSRLTVGVWVVASVVYVGWTFCSGMGDFTRTVTIRGGSVGFSLGAMVYYLRSVELPAWLGPTLVALLVAHASVSHLLWVHVLHQGFYVSLGISMLAIWSLSSVKTADVPGWLSSIDRFLGELAYPIFLSHFLVATLVVAAGLALPGPGRWGMLCWSLPFVHVISYVLSRLVEMPVETLRIRLRPADHS